MSERDIPLIEGEIMNNYTRLIDARAHNEGILEKTFEQRMNLGLEEWLRKAGRLAIGAVGEASH